MEMICEICYLTGDVTIGLTGKQSALMVSVKFNKFFE